MINIDTRDLIESIDSTLGEDYISPAYKLFYSDVEIRRASKHANEWIHGFNTINGIKKENISNILYANYCEQSKELL
jgi:hypothetical protein